MNEFRISLDLDGLPGSISFNGAPWIDNPPWIDVGDLGPVSEAKTKSLLLLALLTEWKRSEGNGEKGKRHRRDDGLCPSLKNFNEQASRSLSEALRRIKTHDEPPETDVGMANDLRPANTTGPEPTSLTIPRQRLTVNRTLDPQAKKVHWLEYIFGEWPLGKFMTGNRTSHDVFFHKDVKIIIEKSDGDELKDDPELKKALYYSYEFSDKQTKRKVAIELHLQSDDERPSMMIIDTNSCEGSFRNNTEFWIRIIANFETCFHVFWISPNDSYILFPPLRFPETCKVNYCNNELELKIGESDKIEITPPNGTEICILLMNQSAKPRNVCKSILAIIKDSIPPEFRNGRLDKPNLTKHNLTLNEDSQRGLIVHPPGRRLKWQQILAQNLQGYGEILYVFSVPHE